MKNKFLKTMLALMLVVCSSIMFACGGGDTLTSYTKLTETMTEFANHRMFTTTSVGGVSSRYVLTPFNSTTYKYVNESLIIPMNYIYKYQDDLSVIKDMKNLNGEQSNAISNLERDLTKIKTGFNKLQNEYDRYLDFQTPGSIHEGVMQALLYETTDFITNAYDIAYDLAEIENKIVYNFNAKVATNEILSAKDTEAFRDYLSLSVGRDFYNLILVQTRSKTFAVTSELGQFITQAKTEFSSFVNTYVAKINFADLTGEVETKEASGKEVTTYKNNKVQKLLDAKSKMDTDRTILEKAFKEFSIYDYGEKYNSNIGEYANANQYAEVHYNQIQSYYLSTLKSYTTYLKSLLFRS